MERSLLCDQLHFRKERGDEIYVTVGDKPPVKMVSCRLQVRNVNTIDEDRPGEHFDTGVRHKMGYVVGKNMLIPTGARKQRFHLTIRPIKRKSTPINLTCSILEMTSSMWTFVVVGGGCHA